MDRMICQLGALATLRLQAHRFEKIPQHNCSPTGGLWMRTTVEWSTSEV